MSCRIRPSPQRPTAHARRGALALLVLLLATTALALPASWIGDLRPAPDAAEYAVTAQRLARGASYTLPLPGRQAPPRYPFGFPALLAPAYWLPGATLQSGMYGVVAFGVAGTPGFGISPKDLAADLAGAAAVELVVALGKALR